MNLQLNLYIKRRLGIVTAREQLAVIISDYNRDTETLECIDSVLSSVGFDKDTLRIYVVENACLEKACKGSLKLPKNDNIILISSQIDLGSSGGLNLGIDLAMRDGYKYICCLGEMITVEPHALRIMLDYLIDNPDTGLAGAKIYHKHMPHYIQQFGTSLDFKNYRASTLFADTYDNGDIPDVVYCDAVGSCGMMVTALAVEKAGLMPEENFLYWDDMEWGYRIKKSGFKVVALGNAVLYHNASPLHRHDNTKVNYYMTRNCINFFMKYTPKEKCAGMSLDILESVFESFYLHQMGQAHNMAQTDLSALNDAIYGIYGKADTNRILPNDETGLLFVNFFEEHECIYMEEDDPFLEQVIRQINPDIIFLSQPKRDAVTVLRCDSILGIRDFSYALDFSEDVVYIDNNYRLLATREDARLVKNYESSLRLFQYAMQPMMLRRISQMRGIEF